MTEKALALRLAERIEKCDRCGGTKPAAAELRRLHAENEMLWKEREEPHQKVAMYVRECNRLEDERDELRKVNAELRKVNAELLEACRTAMMLKHLGGMLPGSREIVDLVVDSARAAIAKAEGA